MASSKVAPTCRPRASSPSSRAAAPSRITIRSRSSRRRGIARSAGLIPALSRNASAGPPAAATNSRTALATFEFTRMMRLIAGHEVSINWHLISIVVPRAPVRFRLDVEHSHTWWQWCRGTTRRDPHEHSISVSSSSSEALQQRTKDDADCFRESSASATRRSAFESEAISIGSRSRSTSAPKSMKRAIRLRSTSSSRRRSSCGRRCSHP